MKTRKLPFDLVRWMRSLDRRPGLRPRPLFTYDLGPLGRLVHPGVPAYRLSSRSRRVTRGPCDD